MDFSSKQLQRAGNDRKNIAKVMRDPAAHLTDGVELLRMKQSGLGLLSATHFRCKFDRRFAQRLCAIGDPCLEGGIRLRELSSEPIAIGNIKGRGDCRENTVVRIANGSSVDLNFAKSAIGPPMEDGFANDSLGAIEHAPARILFFPIWTSVRMLRRKP